MLANGIRIIKQSEDARFVDGKSISFVRVMFMVGEDGPFTEKIDKADFSLNERDNRINAFAAHLAR
jgi:hypothetical protein